MLRKRYKILVCSEMQCMHMNQWFVIRSIFCSHRFLYFVNSTGDTSFRLGIPCLSTWSIASHFSMLHFVSSATAPFIWVNIVFIDSRSSPSSNHISSIFLIIFLHFFVINGLLKVPLSNSNWLFYFQPGSRKPSAFFLIYFICRILEVITLILSIWRPSSHRPSSSCLSREEG